MEAQRPGSLRRLFTVPPFSVLDASNHNWVMRKKEWIESGIRAGVGRGDNLLGLKSVGGSSDGTSQFDPVLTEILLQWFAPCPDRETRPVGSPPDVIVLDPFAGGPVRGAVAASLGFRYFGIDISAEQVACNEASAKEFCKGCRHTPTWVHGSAAHADQLFRAHFGPEAFADVILTCPPYWNLEVYSQLPGDLSNVPTYNEFIDRLDICMHAAVRVLRDRHCIIVVVGNMRSRGELHDIHSDTKSILRHRGCVLYNDAILKTRLHSAPFRACKTMGSACKLVSTHQNVIVACKGQVLDRLFCRSVGIQPFNPDANESTLATHAEPSEPHQDTRVEPKDPRSNAALSKQMKEIQKKTQKMRETFSSTGKAPRVMRTDAKHYNPDVLRYKLCDRAEHEGERLLPLTTEFFYISTGGRGYACRQCKARQLRRRRLEKKGENGEESSAQDPRA